MFDPDGQRVTVMGLGRFGGGLAVTRFLAEAGAQVLLTDLEPEDRLAEPLVALQPLLEDGRVAARLGGHNVSDFTTADAVVVNPAVPRPWDNRFVRAAEAAGVPLLTEIGLALGRLGAAGVRPFLITGTAGKSTTSAMIAHALAALGCPAALGGNIGAALGDDLLNGFDPAQTPHAVVELSSAMLHWLERDPPPVRAAAVAVTGFAPNHLDWHGSPEHYERSKSAILRGPWVTRDTPAVLGPGVHRWPTPPGVARATIDDRAADDPGFGGLLVPGRHNRLNAAIASEAVARAFPDEPGLRERAAEAVRTFPGLPHRLRNLGTAAGLTAFDDSKSTTPEATVLAVEALADARSGSGSGFGRIHLIAGGYDKRIDLSPIAALARGPEPRVASLTTIGATGPALAAAAGPERAHDAGELDAAVRRAVSLARPGDAVLLSPGCASWDQFENYEARGRAFAEAFRAAAGEPETPGPPHPEGSRR